MSETSIHAVNIDRMLSVLSIKTVFELKSYTVLLNILLVTFLVLLRLN